MREYRQFYIGGRWVEPAGSGTFDVVNPATEQVAGTVAAGGADDVDAAVGAARSAFGSWSATTVPERLALLRRILDGYGRRAGDLGTALIEELGAPAHLAHGYQVGLGVGHLMTAIEILETYVFEEPRGQALLLREPIGVAGLITPWNWPLNQIAVKVFPALATGCTMVLKPSERTPFTAAIFAEILHEAGVPAGVFNLVQGDGPGVGVPLSTHPGVDLVSFTGSTRAGVEVARNAAPTVKRVTQELGGKGPNILLDDERFAANVATGVGSIMRNSGQTCSAPSRMLVPAGRMPEAIAAARAAAQAVVVGDPTTDVTIGPVVARSQWDTVQRLIGQGIEDGATLVTGGTGRPDGLDTGWYVRPTVFADATNDMVIAREEIFGPVLVIIGYDSIDHAVEIANDSEYGLTSYVAGADVDLARSIARRIRSGQVVINDAFDFHSPFGGYRRSGNGREWGGLAFAEYLETKAVIGYAPDAG